MYKAAIFGIAGYQLTEEEKNFFKATKPIGFILFSRNIKDKQQLKKLVSELRESTSNPSAPILIDQEGGRVARLKEPHWYHPPEAALFGQIAEHDLKDAKTACRINAEIIGSELAEMGINVDCAPLIDVPVEGANNVIGDRAFSNDPDTITELAASMIEGLTDKGITHIIKHIPGHGRSMMDSHFDLPVVDTSIEELKNSDFIPFISLNNAGWAMTAHIIFTSIDAENPVTHSAKAVRMIREELGFKGILVTDCITMKALKGTAKSNAQDSFNAGCDIVIFSRPNLEEMQDIISITPSIEIGKLRLVPFKQTTKDNNNALKAQLKKILNKYNLSSGEEDIDPTEQHF